MSKKREELDRILDHMNIQVDNPVAVLTQEMSKRFLFTNDSTDKYKVSYVHVSLVYRESRCSLTNISILKITQFRTSMFLLSLCYFKVFDTLLPEYCGY